MIDTDRQPEDNYVTDAVDPDAIERLARRSMGVTGIPQRIHYHGLGVRCGPACTLLGP